MSGDRIARERLYRTADGRVVYEGDPDAAALLAGVGDEIPEGYDVPKKAAAKAEDKAVKGAPNKSKS